LDGVDGVYMLELRVRIKAGLAETSSRRRFGRLRKARR
jgi:hypothetical protein